MSHRRGFTLIELLVVVAIIAILAAILFPVFSQARRKALQGSCLSNEKQIALSFMMYIQDYDQMAPGPDGTGPRVTFVTSYTNPYRTWQDLLFPYMKSVQILWCPSSVWPSSATPGNPNGIQASSYVANGVLLHHTWNSVISAYPGGGMPILMEEVPNPASIILLTEFNILAVPETPDPHLGSHVNPGVQYPIYGPPQMFDMEIPWAAAPPYQHPHGEGYNLAYCDGHVKWQTYTAISSGDFGLTPDERPARSRISCYTAVF